MEFNLLLTLSSRLSITVTVDVDVDVVVVVEVVTAGALEDPSGGEAGLLTATCALFEIIVGRVELVAKLAVLFRLDLSAVSGDCSTVNAEPLENLEVTWKVCAWNASTFLHVVRHTETLNTCIRKFMA